MARLLVGVSGGISAYKAVEVVRLAIKAGHAVRVVQTPVSLRFVGRATFEGITGAPVLVDEFEPDPARGAYPGDAVPSHAPISHLELVSRCDAYVVVPASANTLAKLAGGLADNLLTSAALALGAPLILAPAMNERMWQAPATRANVDLLRARGATVVAPASGQLASRGEWGEGRLAEPSEVFKAIEAAIGATAGAYTPRSLDGLHLVVTAGGTREPIDSVRFLGNRSSGKMGFAIAAEATQRGANVSVIAANVALPRSPQVAYIDVETAAELEHATLEAARDADVVVMAAAVADFRPAAPEPAKITKDDRAGLTLELERTADVLSALGRRRRSGQVIVGFAAEHGASGLARGREKLARKGADAIVVNDIAPSGIGFDADENEVVIVTRGGERRVDRAPKRAIAQAILDVVERLRLDQGAGAATKGEAIAGTGREKDKPK